jgi:hypothetical protein
MNGSEEFRLPFALDQSGQLAPLEVAPTLKARDPDASNSADGVPGEPVPAVASPVTPVREPGETTSAGDVPRPVAAAPAPRKLVRAGLVGRPITSVGARRLYNVQRERATIRLWRAAPEAVSYLRDVVAGRATYEEGKFKCATALLSRCLPVVTSQEVRSDTTNITASLSNDTAIALVRHAQERLREVTDANR